MRLQSPLSTTGMKKLIACISSYKRAMQAVLLIPRTHNAHVCTNNCRHLPHEKQPYYYANYYQSTHHSFRLLPLSCCSAAALFRFTLSTKLLKLRPPPSIDFNERLSVLSDRFAFCRLERSSNKAAILLVFLKLIR